MIPILKTQNCAPLKPLYSLTDKEVQPSYLVEGLTELLKDVIQRDADMWREIAETTEITSNFIQGKQIFQRSSNGWRIQNIRRTDPNKITCINLMQFLCTKNIEKLTSSNPDIEPAEEYRQIALKDRIKKNKAVWNHYERKFYTSWFDQQEALHASISGTYIESVQYDHLAAGAKVFREVWGEKEVPISDGSAQCYSCGSEAPYTAFTEKGMPQCPDCDSHEVNVEAPVGQIIPSVVGMQPIQTGDLCLKLIPIQAARFNSKVQAEESSWFLERSKEKKGVLAKILGRDIDWGEPTDDRGLQSLDSIAKAGNTLFGKDSNAHQKTKDDVTIDRLSLKPEDYYHIKSKAEETVSGEALPEGKMADLFPNGCTVIFANEKHVIGIYPNVHHSKEISSGVYHMRLNSGVGRGSEDTVEVQKRFNRQDAQMVRAGEAGATPAHWYVEGAVDRRHVKQVGMPGSVIPIKQAVATAMGKTELVGQIAPAAISGQFFQYTYDLLDKYRQMTAHAPDVTNGLTGANRSGTATEAQISDSNSEALYGPMLKIKAGCRKGTAQKTIAMFAENFKGVSKTFSHGTTKQDIAVTEQIKGEDVDPSIEMVVVADSERPKTRYGQQQNFAMVMQIVGGAAGLVELKAQSPDLLDNLLKTFDLELDIDDYDTIEDISFKRLTQALEVAKQYEQETQGQIPLIPEILLLGLKPQICPEEMYHPDKMKWFAEYLDTPDGQVLSENERSAIKILIMAHRNGGVQQMGNLMSAETEATMIGQQPAMQQQQQMQQEQNEQQMQGQQATDENQAAMQQSQQEHEAQQTQQAQGFQQQQQANDQDFQMAQSMQNADLEREKIAAQAKSKAKA